MNLIMINLIMTNLMNLMNIKIMFENVFLIIMELIMYGMI